MAALEASEVVAYLRDLPRLVLHDLPSGEFDIGEFRVRSDRVTVTICLTFMNFTLAIFLAGQYFPQPNVLVPVILSVIPWSLLLIPFRALTARLPRV